MREPGQGGQGGAVRIGIDCRELERSRRTGIGRYLRNFVAHVRRSRPGHHFFLYGNQHTDADLGGDNVEVVVEREGLTPWWDQVILPRLARRDRLDVFLSPYMKGPLRLQCPLVITIHDLIELRYPAYRRARGVLVRQLGRLVGRRADLVLTDSQHSRTDIEALLGLPADRVQVLPIGVDETFHPVTDRAALEVVQRRHGIEEPYVLYLGNFKPHKNVAALLRAFAALPEAQRRRHELVLAGGPDPWREDLRALARELGVAARARFIGAVVDADLAPLYSGAQVFVYPSLYEGFGLPPLEAMACGTAVVAAARTSLPEVVGDAGCLVEPDPASLAAVLDRLLGDEAERRRHGEAGLARAAAFRAPELCERQVEILEAVGRRGRRP